MKKKLVGIVAFAALLLAMFAAPAQAVTVNGCKDSNICLYDWIDNNYASGFWQRSYGAISTEHDGGVTGCMNLNTHSWHDGVGSPYETASSMIINQDEAAGVIYYISFRDYLCGGGGPELTYQVIGNRLIAEENLASASKDATCYNYTCTWNWYDRVGSIRIQFGGS